MLRIYMWKQLEKRIGKKSLKKDKKEETTKTVNTVAIDFVIVERK